MQTDLLSALIGVGIVVGGVVVVLIVTTLIVSVRARRTDRRRRDARRMVRGELFERRRHNDPDWGRWVAELSSLEREELAGVIEQYLRTVSGQERAFYLELARTLQMGESADAELASDGADGITRLRALARLTLLDYPISTDRLLETSLDEQRSREAAARLVAERHDEFQRPRALGTGFLIWDGSQPVTAWGVDTLYEHNDGDTSELLLQGNGAADEWEETLLTQVCLVLEASQTTSDPAWFDWLFPLFEHDNPRVREATIRAFRQVGWQPTLREKIPFRTLLNDEPRVRRATYRVLAQWGDRKAHDLLEWAVIDEDDRRAQLLAVRALASLEGDTDPNQDHPAWPDASWEWVRAEIAADERRRLPTQSGVLAP